MDIITNFSELNITKKTAVAIGKFDGLHIGHRRLLDEILTRKREGLAACVFTFDPPPAVLFGGSDGKFLNTREEKRLLFQKLGVDILVEFPLNFQTAAYDPEAFVREILVERMNVAFIAAGTDLSFGAKGAGNAGLLKRLGSTLGFEVMTIDKVCFDGVEVSSTRVREKLEQGELLQVSKLLGMPYMLAGEVVGGNRIGRTIGFPTVNIQPKESKLLPPNGVYFSKVFYEGRMYRAITNIGYKPTVSGERERIPGVETFLYDFNEMIYGEKIELYLWNFHRPECKFESLEALKSQLAEDVLAGEKFWEKNLL